MRIRRLRLVTGLVLLAYLTTHFTNHALGLISLDAMESGRAWFVLFWRNPLVTAALYGSLLIHLGLAFYSLYQRRHLRMPLWEALQLGLGLSIPPLLAAHFAGTRFAYSAFNVQDSYTLLVFTLWAASPDSGLRQVILLLIAWIHGGIGFHFWLRLRPWYARTAPVFLAIGVLLPVLALLGFAEAGRGITDSIARDSGWADRMLRAANLPDRRQRELLNLVQDGIVATFAAGIGIVLLGRAARHARERRNRIRVSYPNGRVVAIPRGFSVLEASRFARIPHASVCGGRGRCSTCRVRIADSRSLPAASAAELRVLQRVGAPPNVRLACQLRPTGDLAIVPVLSPSAGPVDGLNQPAYLAGQERNIAVLFADLRSFTGLAERKLPYDLVFILNSYFHVAGDAVARTEGILDKFIGDGVMALFGVESGPKKGSAQALAAAKRIIEEVDTLSRTLTEELNEPLRIGIGIHTGPAVVGRMGYGADLHVTAIGDTVNVASRLQELSKEYRCQLVISEATAHEAGLNVSSLPRNEIVLRNRRETLVVYTIESVGELSCAETAGGSLGQDRRRTDSLKV